MKKRKLLIPILLLMLLLPGCTAAPDADIAATTLPVYEFTSRLAGGTDLTVCRLVTENVSCLHDYSLQVSQMRAIEGADLVVISGAGLEDFLGDALAERSGIVDASAGIPLLCGEGHGHDDDAGGEDHHHEFDPHLWLSPENAKAMARTICDGLSAHYPAYASQFAKNLNGLLRDLDALQAYGEAQLSALSCRELVTFHDGFSYFASAFDLEILKAVEEESGAETSAAALKALISLVRAHELPAIFTESNGSVASAAVISRETGADIFTLDMAMAGDSYFDAMYHNIDTIKEALG